MVQVALGTLVLPKDILIEVIVIEENESGERDEMPKPWATLDICNLRWLQSPAETISMRSI